ncbi:MAG: cytochrome c biogenesis protein CcdA [Candidatus Omnitrophota bacterium]
MNKTNPNHATVRFLPVFISLLLVCLYAGTPFSFGQFPGENRFSPTEPIIDTEVKYDEGLILFNFDVGDNAHITDLKYHFFNIKLEKNPYAEIREVVFPQPVPSGEENVFKGKFSVKVWMTMKSDPALKEPATLKFNVSYQMCKEKPLEMCFPPDEKPIDVKINQPFKASSLPSTTPPPSTAEAGPSQSPIDLSAKTAPPIHGRISGETWKFFVPIGLILIGLSVFFGLTKSLTDPDNDSIVQRSIKALIILVLFAGIFLFMAGLDIKYFPGKYVRKPEHKPVTLTWLSDPDEGKAISQKENKPLLIDTTAAWCVACKELEEYTFSDPGVANVLKNYVRVRIDFTQKTAKNEELRNNLKVIGMPTLIVLDPEGKEIRRGSGFMEKAKFLEFLGTGSGWLYNMEKLLKRELDNRSLLLIVLILGLGFLTSLTPCVYPVIPIVMGYIGTRSGKKKLKGFYLSVFFVLGLAIVYSTLGVIAATTGSMMGVSFQNPIVVIIISAIFMIMGLSMAGLFEIPVPSSLSSKMQSSKGKGEVIGALIVGGVSGIIAAPCVGPVLIALISWISQTRNIFLGFWLTFIFSLGMGIIFLLAGTFSGVISAMPKGGKWMDYIKYTFAILLVGGGIYIMKAIIPVWVSLLLWGVFLMAAGVLVGLLTRHDDYRFDQRLYKFIVLIVFLAGTFMLFKSLEMALMG